MARPRRVVRDRVLSETRQRLLDAATAEIAREGYVGANINRISQAAGFAKGTVYNHFPSKRALMEALIDEIAATHTQFIRQQIERQQDPTQRLECFFSAGFAFVEDRPEQARVIINSVYGPDAGLRAHVYEAYRELFTLIAQSVVQAGIARGDFRSLDPDLVTALVMTIYLGSSSQLDPSGTIWLNPGQVIAFIVDGLRPR